MHDESVSHRHGHGPGRHRGGPRARLVVPVDAVGAAPAPVAGPDSAWFRELEKPVLYPPAIFGVVRTAPFTLMCVALWTLVVAIVATVAAVDRVDRRAAALPVPYLLWVTFVAVPDYRVWRPKSKPNGINKRDFRPCTQ